MRLSFAESLPLYIECCKQTESHSIALNVHCTALNDFLSVYIAFNDFLSVYCSCKNKLKVLNIPIRGTDTSLAPRGSVYDERLYPVSILYRADRDFRFRPARSDSPGPIKIFTVIESMFNTGGPGKKLCAGGGMEDMC